MSPESLMPDGLLASESSVMNVRGCADTGEPTSAKTHERAAMTARILIGWPLCVVRRTAARCARSADQPHDCCLTDAASLVTLVLIVLVGMVLVSSASTQQVSPCVPQGGRAVQGPRRRVVEDGAAVKIRACMGRQVSHEHVS